MGKTSRLSRPTVGVLEFSNRLGDRRSASLGRDLAEQLAEELIISQDFTVFQPAETQALLGRAMPDIDSPEEAAYYKTVSHQPIQYLIRGKVTDYGFVELSGIQDRLSEMKLLSSGYAQVAVTLYVTDLRSGHTVSVSRLKGTVSCDPKMLVEEQKGGTPRFGSSGYFRTIMGKATRDLLRQAVREVHSVIKNPPYQPKIASLINDQVVINGGRDKGIRPYQRFEVRPASQIVIDPDSARYLGHVTGEKIGTILVTQVYQNYALARVVQADGPLEPHQTLFPISAEQMPMVTPEAVQSHQ